MSELMPCPNCGESHPPGECSQDKKFDLTAEGIKRIADQLQSGNDLPDAVRTNSKLQSELARKLIEAGHGVIVAANIDKFAGLEQKLAVALIDAGQGWAVVDNLNSFAGLDHQEIVVRMIEAKQGRTVAENIYKFTGLDNNEIALKLIEAGEERSVAVNLGNFSFLKQEVSLKLIEAGFSQIVANNLHKFTLLDKLGKKVALKLIETGDAKAVVEQLNRFTDLDQEVALELIRQGQARAVAEYSLRLNRFTDLDQEVASALIDTDQGWAVALYLDKFTGLDHQEVALRLIKAGAGRHVADNIEKFQGLNHREIAKLLILDNIGSAVVENLDQFPNLDQEIALLLIEHGCSKGVAENLNKFTGLDHREIVHRIIDTGHGTYVTQNIEKFQGLDRAIAFKLIEFGHARAVSNAISEYHQGIFLGLDREVALALIESGEGETVAQNLDVFQGIDHKEVALKLIETGQPAAVYHNLEEYKGLDATVGVALLYYGVNVLNHPQLLPSSNTEPYVKKLWDFYNDKTISPKVRQSKEVLEHVRISVASKEERNRVHDTAALSASLTHFLSPQEYLNIVTVNPDALVLDEKGKINARAIVVELENDNREGGNENIADALAEGVEHFGAEAMLKYINRPDLSRHDALYFMPQLLHLQEQSGLSPAQFSKNILLQVAKDGTAYEQGTAHHYFAAICDALKDTSPADIFDEIKKYPKIKELQKLAREMQEGHPLASWKSLKKLYEIQQLLGRTEILNRLQADINPRLRVYVERLAFHPNISTDAVIQFWTDPAEFLAIDDAHTPEAINACKKPSNLLSLPYLGLDATDLRDALVNGELDDLQVLPPMERRYYFGTPVAEQIKDDAGLLHYALRNALGERKKGVKGTATNVPKLFSEAQSWCRKNNIPWAEIWDINTGLERLAALSTQEREALRALIYQKDIGIRGEQEPLQVYRAHIGYKSDPEMVVAGNDTASCMPFGSGKNNVYMFNPTYAQMVVERLTEEGRWRTAAQSVLSVDHKTATSTPELMRAYLEQGVHLKDLVKSGDLERLPVVTCDNIEPAKNEEGQRVRYLHEIYQKFFEEYLRRFAEQLQVSIKEVPIGTGYTPSDLGFREVQNTYIPQAPAGYSDNIHETCFVIETGLPEIEQKYPQMAPLTVRDAVSVAVLEGKAYTDNATLVENLHRMQNNLIGMRIANRHFHRPNLSFLYRDQKGTPRGYILAYAGLVEHTSVVFIDDLATDRENKMAGGRLIKQFFETYADAYGTEERPWLPIYTNARDKTSFPILERHAQRLAEEKGLQVRLIEVGTHYRGDDLMRDVVVVIGKTEDDLQAQEKAMREVFVSFEKEEEARGKRG